MIFPITFSIPNDKIVVEIPLKTKFLSNLVPGDLATYIYNTEEAYYNEYKKSLFATTYKKAGWDCMRHYEILACGCIPYFPNIENCPSKTMYHLPKKLIIEGNKLYERISQKLNNKYISEELINISQRWRPNISTEVAIDIYSNLNTDIDRISKEDLKLCYELINKLLQYTKNNLTCCSVCKYVLSSTSNTNINSILYLSGDLRPNYLRDLMLRGFKDILKKKCYDIPKVNCLYEKNGTGGLHTIRHILEHHEHEEINNIESRIRRKEFDIIIYGSYHRGMPYYDFISKIYKPDKIILLCGEDSHVCKAPFFSKRGHYVFVRELYFMK